MNAAPPAEQVCSWINKFCAPPPLTCMVVGQRAPYLAGPRPMQKHLEELKVEFQQMVAWCHTRSWKRYKPGNNKTKIYLWNIHQQTRWTRLWLSREGLVHQTAAWLSEEDCLFSVGSLAVFFVGDNKNCPEENMMKCYFQTAQWLHRSHLRLWFLSYYFTAFFCFNKNVRCVSACGELQMC